MEDNCPDILRMIVEKKQPEVALLRRLHDRDAYFDVAAAQPATRDLREMLHEEEGIGLIAELKRASPSEGLIRPDFDPVLLARQMHEGGAQILSILTEANFFLGEGTYLLDICQEMDVALLRKDFVWDSMQIAESRLLGADAVLLIVALLTEEELAARLEECRELDLQALVEVHTPEEMVRAAGCGAELIGINSRNLHTFQVDLNAALELRKLAPDGCTVVAESGIQGRNDMLILQEAGFDAALVGSWIMRRPDVGWAVRMLLGTTEEGKGDV